MSLSRVTTCCCYCCASHFHRYLLGTFDFSIYRPFRYCSFYYLGTRTCRLGPPWDYSSMCTHWTYHLAFCYFHFTFHVAYHVASFGTHVSGNHLCGWTSCDAHSPSIIFHSFHWGSRCLLFLADCFGHFEPLNPLMDLFTLISSSVRI